MWAAEFREIAIACEGGKAERLFRASVSAFCALTRPSRREVTQLDDLTLPLFDHVTPAALRYVAAALSECSSAPPYLVARLCDQSIDIAAPLLVRSWLLADSELIALIGRHGLGHARAIARRPNLNPTIRRLVRALELSASSDKPQDLEKPAPLDAVDLAAHGKADSAKVEKVRGRLRSLMRRASPGAEAADVGEGHPFLYPSLRDSAMTGDQGNFHASFAQALGLDVETARVAIRSSSYASLLAGLRALDLSEEQAFLITAAACPQHFVHAEAVRLFTARYRALDLETARERVRGWKLDMVATWIQRQRMAERFSSAPAARIAANSTARREELRAS